MSSKLFSNKEIKKAVDYISIKKGELVGYIGANGASKSTTIKMLSGILVPTSVEFKEKESFTSEERYKIVKESGNKIGFRFDKKITPVKEALMYFTNNYEINDIHVANSKVEDIVKKIYKNNI